MVWCVWKLNYFLFLHIIERLLLQLGSGYASEFVVINPQNRLTMDGQTVDVEMRVDGGNNIKVYRSQEGAFSNWQEVEASVEGGVARFQVGDMEDPGTLLSKTISKLDSKESLGFNKYVQFHSRLCFG